VLDPERKVGVNVTPVEVFEYDNGSVALLNPQFPTWVRTSSTGLWIFQYLKENPSNFSETVSAVANHYGLPPDAVRETTIGFLEEMLFAHFLIRWDSAQEESVPTLPRAVELSELGLQELWLDVTSLCHGTCRHCYKPKKDTYHFPVSELEDLLVQAKTLGVASLTISGGEPLLHPEFSHMMTLARRVSDWTIKVITAGQGSSSEIVDALMENADIIQVSLDGKDKETNDLLRGEGASESAAMLLKLLREHKNRDGKKVGLGFTPLPQNVDQIQELDKLGYVLGIDFLHLNHLKRPANLSGDMANYKLNRQGLAKKSLRNFNELAVKMVWKESHRDERSKGVKPISLDPSFAHYYDLFDPLKKRSCGGGITTLCIIEKGDVYPCAALQPFPEACLGNWIKERDLPELYSQAQKWNESVFSVDACHQCKDCHFRYLCGGGCRASTDSLSEPDIMCESIMESYHRFFEFAGIASKKKISDRESEALHENRSQGKTQFKFKQCS
jgi:radical SAM protein with 4Fe4S-binding SPASM domain